MKREYKLYIKDILECIEKIEAFVKGMNFDKFVKDNKTTSAVINKIEIIGEATKNIPMHVRDKYKDVPWSDMAKMRDKIVHFYFGVDYEIVWRVIKEKLPEIKPIMHKILKGLEET